VDAFAGIPIERPIIEAYLGLFASTPDELAAKLDACPGSWQMLPIQERPLLRVGDVILVLDEQYLIERATQGLYWFVHDHERDLDSKRGRPRWNNAHAAMVELRVEDQLHKAEQLDVTAANLLSDPQPANSPLTAPAPRILPVAIRGGQFPLNPVTRRHIEDALQQKGLLHYRSGAPITRIALLDLEELELCESLYESLYESRGLTLPQLIAQ